MADWRKLVRQRLDGLALDRAERDAVHSELAGHLEESYESLRTKGLPEKEAMRRALAQIPDWTDLQRKIFVAKTRGDLMQKRVRQLWVPGFLVLILSMLFLTALQKLGLPPRIVWSGPTAILLYVPWLLSLPFIGALGSFVSYRAGGSRGTVLLASVFPALALATAFLLMSPIGMALERLTGSDRDFVFVATALLKDGIGWLLIPAAALFVGGLIAHILLSVRSSPQNAAIS